MLTSSFNVEIPWLDLISIASAVALFEGAVTGKGRTAGRGAAHYWPVPFWLRPVFALVGFSLFAFGLLDLLRRFAH